ncbi:hypothetical protein PR048_015407 [Dryococelus australis]|uniref:DDE Tnp4 domain-containing protein n=1 Tax=Dryococelus australis TaxID=614101 RepID=A0ABQ9HGV5_9NEOP|nr:hypothetical protein PR048_015407 [Dryococelus australis]
MYVAGVIGVLDSCLISVTVSKDSHKSSKCVILQAVCTSELLFTDVFVVSHDVSDENVLASSGLYEMICAKGRVALFHNTYCLVADTTYPIREWLVVPYKDHGNLSQKKKRFNAQHRCSRALAERCFGLLKGRWRRLLHVNRTDMAKVWQIVMACCVLQNLCRRNYDNLEDAEPVQLLRTCQVLNEDKDNEAAQLGVFRRMRITKNL